MARLLFSHRRAHLKWTPEGGTPQLLEFDSVTTEQQEGTVEVTSHPVERGPNVTDHVRTQLDQVTLEVFISNEPLYDIGERGALEQSVTLDVPRYIPPLTPTPGSLFAAVGGAISALFGQKVETYQAQVLRFPRAFDIVAEVHGTLKDLLEAHQLIDVYTSTREYRDMILTKVGLPRTLETGSGGAFQLTFQQIRRVEVKLVTAPIPTVKRAKKQVDKGPQGPTPPPGPTKSLAAATIDKVASKVGGKKVF